jgi:hypothetical protein
MPSNAFAPPVPSLKEQLVRESCAMVRHLVTNGTRVPPAVIQSTDQFEAALEQKQAIDVAALAATHERLSRLVAPAKPGTLYLLDFNFHQQGRAASTLGPIKLVRDLVRVAMVCVGLFIVLSVVAVVEAHPDIALFGSSVPGQDANHPLLILRVILERVFWLSAAGIGAAFAMLFTLNDQIIARTYDPDETASYWVKFFLGVVAGFILVALVPVDTTADTGAEALGPPTIAMLGGFSASAVYRILTRMVEALESVFSGGAREQAAVAEKLAAARSAEEGVQARMAVAGQLVEIQQQIAAGMPAEQASTQLRQVVATLVPASGEASEVRPAAPAKVPAFAVVGDPADAEEPADGQEGDVPAPTSAAAG